MDRSTDGRALRLPLLATLLLPWTAAPLPVRADTPPIEERVDNDSFYCAERRLGRHFYCAAPKPAPDPPAPLAPEVQVTAVPQPPSARDRLKALSTEVEELKAAAILEPSPENLERYMRLQRRVLDMSSTFADQWQRLVWTDPELDYTLERPVSTLGKRLWLDERTAAKDATMAALGERYGLFYLFSADCGACKVFAPILKGVADNHGLHVMAVSQDGGPSETFPDYVVDGGQVKRLGLDDPPTPAVVLFDTLTGRAQPVGYGLMAADDLVHRIYVLTETEVGRDY